MNKWLKVAIAIYLLGIVVAMAASLIHALDLIPEWNGTLFVVATVSFIIPMGMMAVAVAWHFLPKLWKKLPSKKATQLRYFVWKMRMEARIDGWKRRLKSFRRKKTEKAPEVVPALPVSILGIEPPTRESAVVAPATPTSLSSPSAPAPMGTPAATKKTRRSRKKPDEPVVPAATPPPATPPSIPAPSEEDEKETWLERLGPDTLFMSGLAALLVLVMLASTEWSEMPWLTILLWVAVIGVVVMLGFKAYRAEKWGGRLKFAAAAIAIAIVGFWVLPKISDLSSMLPTVATKIVEADTKASTEVATHNVNETVAPAAVLKSSGTPGIDTAGIATFTIREGEPQQISVPPGHRWDLVEPPASGWTTDSGYRDKNGNRIQVFEVVAPATEVRLTTQISLCSLPRGCAW